MSVISQFLHQIFHLLSELDVGEVERGWLVPTRHHVAEKKFFFNVEHKKMKKNIKIDIRSVFCSDIRDVRAKY